MIVAEELSCDWRRVQVVQADLHPKYGDQLTGGSGSVRDSHSNLRKAGAAAREMLLSAAAAQWNVPRSECRAESSFVTHARTRRKLAFEQLFAAASALQPAADPPLRILRTLRSSASPRAAPTHSPKQPAPPSSVWTRAFRECSSRQSNAVPFTGARRAASTPTR